MEHRSKIERRAEVTLEEFKSFRELGLNKNLTKFSGLFSARHFSLRELEAGPPALVEMERCRLQYFLRSAYLALIS
jgi:hypothetical protein